MKPFQRLSLIIILASLLPTLAIVWARMNESQDLAGVVALRISVQRDIALRTTDESEEWLRKHAGHCLAPQVDRILHPDELARIQGANTLDILLRSVTP